VTSSDFAWAPTAKAFGLLLAARQTNPLRGFRNFTWILFLLTVSFPIVSEEMNRRIARDPENLTSPGGLLSQRSALVRCERGADERSRRAALRSSIAFTRSGP
jgi:hypothetical protein